MSALAVVMLFCVTTAPASALTEEKNRTDTDSGKIVAYSWDYILTTTGDSTTATLRVGYSGYGAVLLSISAEVNGHILSSSGREVSLNKSAEASGTEAAYVNSVAEAGYSYTVEHVVCRFYALGDLVGSYDYDF